MGWNGLPAVELPRQVFRKEGHIPAEWCIPFILFINVEMEFFNLVATGIS